MAKNLRNRVVTIGAVILLSFIFFFPPDEKIKLGLDLKGGMHLIIQVDTDAALEELTKQTRDGLDAGLKEKAVSIQESRVLDRFKIDLIGVSNEQRDVVESYFADFYPDWSYRSESTDLGLTYHVEWQNAVMNLERNRIVEQVQQTIRRRIDEYGVAEPTVSRYGSGGVSDQIIVELPGVDDPERVKTLIRTAAQLHLKIAHDQGGPFASQADALAAFGGQLPEGYELAPVEIDPQVAGVSQQFLVVRDTASLTGQHLKNARRSQDQFTGRSEVVFFLTADGVRLFSQTTEQNIGSRLAIVLDGRVQSYPNINERIDSESARITGVFSPEEAEDLSVVLRSGALPAPIRFLEDLTVGPSLGRDSIRSGISASILGLTLVIVAMIVFYRLSGVNAVICLAINLMILMGALAYLGATLTLPGIAGIILTIGMAVDANILIFERIKEELRFGKTVRSAVESGFNRVFTTIVDTNITTLVAALFLFQFGTGPIRGFAITLAVGLLANIFTATFVSRTFFAFLLRRREVEALSI